MGHPIRPNFHREKVESVEYGKSKIISEQYEEIFKHYHNRGEWRKAREIANGMLNDAANDFGLSLSEYKSLKLRTMILLVMKTWKKHRQELMRWWKTPSELKTG